MDRALYATQGGGVCRFTNGVYTWVEVPGWLTGAEIGDEIPAEWGVSALNDAAIQEAENNR